VHLDRGYDSGSHAPSSIAAACSPASPSEALRLRSRPPLGGWSSDQRMAQHLQEARLVHRTARCGDPLLRGLGEHRHHRAPAAPEAWKRYRWDAAQGVAHECVNHLLAQALRVRMPNPSKPDPRRAAPVALEPARREESLTEPGWARRGASCANRTSSRVSGLRFVLAGVDLAAGLRAGRERSRAIRGRLLGGDQASVRPGSTLALLPG